MQSLLKTLNTLRHVLFMVVKGTEGTSFCAYLGDLNKRILRFLESNALAAYKSQHRDKVNKFLLVLKELLGPCHGDRDYESHKVTGKPLHAELKKISDLLEACVNDRQVQDYYRDCISSKSITHCTKQRWMQLMAASQGGGGLTEGQLAKARGKALAKIGEARGVIDDMEFKSKEAEKRMRKHREEFESKMEEFQELLDQTKAQQNKIETDLAGVRKSLSLTGDRTSMVLEDS